MPPDNTNLIFNRDASRYKLQEAGHTVYADIREEDGVFRIDYVYAPPELRGTGAAGRLMQGMIDEAAKKGLTIRPVCGYAAAWMRRHDIPSS